MNLTEAKELLKADILTEGDLDALMQHADALAEALEEANNYMCGWTGCKPQVDERDKQYREWKEVTNNACAALAQYRGTP